MTGQAEQTTLTPAAQRILDVASDLFYRNGIRAVGVDMIAREAGVTKKTIYDRFGSKDALIKAYLDRRDHAWHRLIAERVERTELSPRDRILAMFEIMSDELRDRGCSFINTYAEFGEVEHPGVELAISQKIWTRNYFAELARQAGAHEPETLGSQLLMLHEGAYVAYAMVGESDAAERSRDAAAVLVDAALSNR